MTKVCAWCDRHFAPRSRTQACCSNRCRQYLNEWRKRQARDYQPPVRGSDRRQRGTTAAQRGLGTPHQRARGLLLTQLRASSVMYCPFCHAQLRHGQQLDFDHSLPRGYGGTTGDRLAHSAAIGQPAHASPTAAAALRSGEPSQIATSPQPRMAPQPRHISVPVMPRCFRSRG
jgi:hypothetical protein